jgi:hypothetical protein
LPFRPIDKTKATLNAKPTLSGNDTASITFFWGDNNGSNSGNHNQWDHNFTVSGTHSSGAVLSHPITGLTTGTTYYAVARVTNSLNTSAYGSVVSFKAADRTFTKHSIRDSSSGSMLQMSMVTETPIPSETEARFPHGSTNQPRE